MNRLTLLLSPFPSQTLLEKNDGLPWYFLKKLSLEHSLNTQYWTMITSQKNEPWPLDVTIKHKNESGLTAPSIVRMKLFTLDNRLILKKVGHLSKADQEQVKQNLSTIFDYP